MKNNEQLKQEVKDKYSQIASKPTTCGCCGTKNENPGISDQSDDYSHLEGYLPDADLNLGCGVPTEFAKISAGDTVVDLGSGAGNDCFVARALTGEEGHVIGVDFTESMVDKAKRNAAIMGYKNVEFVYGDIENIPVENDKADVVISNCVMNLVPDKEKAFAETYRILKAGGHFSISDIVIKGSLPEGLRESAALYAGCVSGAIEMDDYLAIIKKTGFKNVSVQRQKSTRVPEELMLEYIGKEEIDQYRKEGKGIFSITVYGEK